VTEWDYLVLPRKQADTTTQQLSHDLGPLGALGWELVAIWAVNASLGDQFIFKRPRPEA
jgi:hypothetical protein